MKTHDSKTSTNHSTAPQKPFFSASPDHAFFSTQKTQPTPFFQPQTSAIQAKSATSEEELQRMPAFDSEVTNNGEIQRKLINSPQDSSTLPIQAKLTIGEPGNKYEQEADRVASQVVEQINTPAPAQSTQAQTVQRQGGEEEELQAKPEITAIQRMEEPEEQLQAKSNLQHQEAIGGGEASTDLTSAINSVRGGGQPLDAGLQRSMGQAMGADFSGVRVHTDTQADQLNRSIQAKAFATGQDVFFRQGEYSPGSRGGQELIAHELTHVVQQNGGVVMRSPLVSKPIISNTSLASLGLNMIQMVMSIAEFQSATPAKFLKPRQDVTLIDAALGTYIGAKTTANALNLIDVINNYLAGRHDAERKQVARNLLAEIPEYDLLHVIGNANRHLIDPLFQLADVGRRRQLVDLANAVTPVNAAHLHAIVTATSPENIFNLIHSQLIPAMGVGHIPLLPHLITQSGGVTQFTNLRNVINLNHAGQGDRAVDLANEAGGDPNIFARLADEVPFFLQTARPGAIPADVAAAAANYDTAVVNHNNNVVLPGFIAQLRLLASNARTAHTQATNLGGINAGLLGNVNGKITDLSAEILTLQRLIPGRPAFYDAGKTLANQVNQVLTPLQNQVTQRVILLGAGVPATFNEIAFNTSVGNAQNARTNADATVKIPTIAGIGFDHFLERHTPHYFNFGDIKPDNTQWVPAWGAASSANVARQFIGVLNNLYASQNWLIPLTPKPTQAVPMGGTAQIAGLAAPNNQINIGQFFPEANPGVGNYDHPASTMNAIRRLL